MKGIKIYYGKVTKRINGPFDSLDNFLQKIPMLFGLPKETKFSLHSVNGDKKELLSSNEQFLNLCKQDKLIKFELSIIQTENKNQVINVGDKNILTKIDALLNSKFQQLENKISTIFKSQTIKSQWNTQMSVPLNQSQKAYSNEICNYCHNPLNLKKYQCIICDNLILCENCEHTHYEHPLIKFDLNANYKSLKNKEEIVKYLKTSNEVVESKKPRLFSMIKNIFVKNKNDDYFLKLFKKDKICSFAVPLNAQYPFIISLTNETNVELTEEIEFIIKNSYGLTINTISNVKRIEAFQTVDILFTVEHPKECRTYKVDLTLHTNKNKIVYQPLALEIKVVEKEDLEKTNADLLLKDYDEIAQISTEDKIQLYRLIVNGSEQNAKEINVILGKYNLQLPDYEDDDN